MDVWRAVIVEPLILADQNLLLYCYNIEYYDMARYSKVWYLQFSMVLYDITELNRISIEQYCV